MTQKHQVENLERALLYSSSLAGGRCRSGARLRILSRLYIRTKT
jgi:hypothetical protein